MRKRKGKFVTYTKPKEEVKILKKPHNRKKYMTVLMLIGIFCVVLFLNSYFNYTSNTVYNTEGTTLGERFFLSGPDPYLNMRTCEEALKQGRYPYVSPHSGDDDPLLNYPVGERGSRPPLFNMMAIGSAMVLQNFMPQMDALGWSMLFLPAIYGALLVFPIYGIGRTLFNRKVGLIAALLVALIPIHIGGSHGSTLSLFDHDSFLLLLFTCIFYFVIKSLKEQKQSKSLIYSAFAGVFVGAVYLTWTASQFIFLLLLLTFIILLIFDIFKSKVNIKLSLNYVTMFTIALLISLPWILVHGDDLIGYPVMSLGVALFLLALCYVINKLKVPWIISLPAFGVLGCIGITFLYLIHLGVIQGWGAIQQLSITIFGEGIYGSKVSLTVAEAHNYGISQTILSFGPAIYWIGLTGFVLYCIKTFKEKIQPWNLFFIIVFIVDLWLTSTAGRFLNDLIPTLVIFTAFCLFLILDKIDYQKMLNNLKHFDGFNKRKAIHLSHIFGVCFMLFLVVAPNAFLTIDAAVPAETKEDVFGKGYVGAFGNSNTKTILWVDAFSWLNKQDTELKDVDKPAFISWWDYGFYEVAVAHHPTVADNYQVGMYASGNFKLATTEQEAISVLIIRCCEGNKHHSNGLTQNVKDVIQKYLLPVTYQVNETFMIASIPTNITKNVTTYPADLFIKYINNPTSAPTYNTLVAPEYGNTELRVREDNAMYHDCWKLMKNLTDVEITNFYKDIQKVTGYSIRYYGTEEYDTQIFGVFTFLTDRGTQGFLTHEDDYFIELYEDKNTGYKYETWQIEKWTEKDFEGKDLQPMTEYKPLVYETMWYKTYYGYGEFPSNRLPTYGLRHFKLAYYNPMVVISKYYEGATVNGTIKVDGQPYGNVIIYVIDEFGIPHDNCVSDNNGNFTLLAPAGNLSFRAFVSQNLRDLEVASTLNITEDEGRQIVSCNKNISFNVSYATAQLFIETNQTNLTLAVIGSTYGSYYAKPFSNNTMFNLTDLMPDEYSISVTNMTNAVLYSETLYLKPGDNKKDVKIQTGQEIN